MSSDVLTAYQDERRRGRGHAAAVCRVAAQYRLSPAVVERALTIAEGRQYASCRRQRGGPI